MARRGWRLTFRRWLDEHLQNQLRRLHDLISSFSVRREIDIPKWLKEKLRLFSIKSIYKSLCSQEMENYIKPIRNAKIPLRIKIFLLIYNNAILTKDNLVKKIGLGMRGLLFAVRIKPYHTCCLRAPQPSMCGACGHGSGARCRPGSLDQFWVWVKMCIPRGDKFICCGACSNLLESLDSKKQRVLNEMIQSPTEIICSACCSSLTGQVCRRETESNGRRARRFSRKRHCASTHKAGGGAAGTRLLQQGWHLRTTKRGKPGVGACVPCWSERNGSYSFLFFVSYSLYCFGVWELASLWQILYRPLRHLPDCTWMRWKIWTLCKFVTNE